MTNPFRKKMAYLPETNGSFSIKQVLPSIYPDDPELDYHNLDERVQNGGDAMTIFPKLTVMREQLPKLGVQEMEDGRLVLSDSLMKLSDIVAKVQEINTSREALLEYCKLDTWAMVKVWQKLKEVAD